MPARPATSKSLPFGDSYAGIKIGGTAFYSGEAAALSSSFALLTIDPTLFTGGLVGRRAVRIIATCTEIVTVCNEVDEGSSVGGEVAFAAGDEIVINLSAWLDSDGNPVQGMVKYIKAADTAALSYRVEVI